MAGKKRNEELFIMQPGFFLLKRMRIRLGRMVRLFFWPLDRILAPNCRGEVFPPNGAEVLMTYDGPAPEINKLPAGFVVSTMRIRDFLAWFALMHTAELVWSLCLDGLVKFILDRRFSRYPTFLIWRRTQLVASASLWEEETNSNRILLVHMVAVDPETRGMGLGTHVTCLVMDYLRKELSVQDKIWLRTNGTPAQKLYEKIGFSVVLANGITH